MATRVAGPQRIVERVDDLRAAPGGSAFEQVDGLRGGEGGESFGPEPYQCRAGGGAVLPDGCAQTLDACCIGLPPRCPRLDSDRVSLDRPTPLRYPRL